MASTRFAAGLAASAAVLLVPLVGPATAAPPTRPECATLAGGSTGVLVVGGAAPSSDQLEGRPGGLGDPAPAGVRLPDRVVFKDLRHTFSNEYAFVLRKGKVYVRPAVEGLADPGQPWRLLELPSCLDGHVSAISADHRFLLALDEDRQLFSHDMPGGDLSADRWTWRWGPYFWTGSGMTMFEDVRRWAVSEFNASETFTDTSGREHHAIGVGTVYLLRGDHRRITYLDPWLPQDESREICGPHRGTLPLANLDGSGSTLFVVGKNGALYTRMYDFDLSGANTVFGDYSWERRRPADDTRWQLPGPGWVHHPRPPGTLTDRVTVLKTGADAADRLLRVEGRDRRRRTGYWEKRIGAAHWRFVATGGRLHGQLLPSGGDEHRFAPHDMRYEGMAGGRPAVVGDFNPECSPARLTVRLPGHARLTLRLHSTDGLRQERRDRGKTGLTDVPREYNGAVEVPRRVWRHLHARPPAVRAWVDANLDGRFTTAPLAVTSTRLRFLAQCWELTLDGDPARPDQPGLPPDGGMVVGRLTELAKDGRSPSTCLP